MPQPPSSRSLVLPVSRRVFWLRVALLLLFDVALAAAGIALFLKSRERPAAPTVVATAPPPADKPSVVEVPTPTVLKRPKRPATGPRTSGTRPPSPSPSPSPKPEIPAPVAVPTLPDAAPVSVTPPSPLIDAAPAAVPPAPPAAADAGPLAAPPPDDSANDERAARIAELIRDTMREGRVQIDKCYERASKVDTRGLAGTIEVELTILPTGATDDVRVVENDTGSEELGECLAALLRSWKFPSPGGEPIEFSWPFVFKGR